MAKDIIITTGAGALAALVELTDEHEDAISRARAASQASNTSRTYRAQLRVFERWCMSHGYSAAAPVDPRVVAAFIADRQQAGASRSTLGVAIAAIRAGHAAAGLRFDDRHPDLEKARKGASRLAARTQKQAQGFTPDLIKGLIEISERAELEAKGAAESTFDLIEALRRKANAEELAAAEKEVHEAARLSRAARSRATLASRDCAMVALLYMGALRRSELIGLNLIEMGRDTDATGVLRIGLDGLEVELIRSKTSQAESVKVFVSRDANPRGFAALERWVREAGIEPGTPVIRRITPTGAISKERISGEGLSAAVKSAVRRYHQSNGVDRVTAEKLAAKFSGHSGRVGFVVAAKSAGAADTDVAVTTRHKSLAMIARYGEQADQKRRAAHKLRGVGV